MARLLLVSEPSQEPSAGRARQQRALRRSRNEIPHSQQLFPQCPLTQGCCWEYLVVSADLHVRVLADHPICGQQLENGDKSMSLGNPSLCWMLEIQNPAISTPVHSRQPEQVTPGFPRLDWDALASKCSFIEGSPWNKRVEQSR